MHELRTLKTLELPRMVREKQLWDPSVCLNFGRLALDWLVHEVMPPPRSLASFTAGRCERRCATIVCGCRWQSYRILPAMFFVTTQVCFHPALLLSRGCSHKPILCLPGRRSMCLWRLHGSAHMIANESAGAGETVERGLKRPRCE